MLRVGHAADTEQPSQALRYKPVGRGFDARWNDVKSFHWFNPSGRAVANLATDINEYHRYLMRGKGGRGAVFTLTPLRADCLGILGALEASFKLWL